MPIKEKFAPGWPGMPPRWTSSAKSGVGTSIGAASRVWFTLSHGIFNEIYYPRIDMACTRDMGLIVTDAKDFFSEEKRHTRSIQRYLAEGVPAFHLRNKCVENRYAIEKTILTDPKRETVMQKTFFKPMKGTLSDYRLYVLLAPHLANRGSDNTAWVGDYKGTPMLFAERNNYAIALACSTPFLKLSAGFVGFSDGWQDLYKHKQMEWEYERAENGNVALTGEIDLKKTDGEFILSLGFGGNAAEAGSRALTSMLEGFERAKEYYINEWEEWQSNVCIKRAVKECKIGEQDLLRVSTAVLKTHEAKNFPGGLIASLSIPWGTSKGDEELGGYHLVWPRDLVETAGGLLAVGDVEDAKRIIYYLWSTQEADGHWPQNMWMDGTPSWRGVQLDETAFPILLVDLARREGALDGRELRELWPMVKKAASYIVRNGPVTPEDRWEEDPGYSPFTLAVEISALLAASEAANILGEPEAGKYLKETADLWNASIERWTYATDTDLSRDAGVEGYYVRIAPPEVADAASPLEGFVPIKNRPFSESKAQATHIISPDALALVRFGLRSPSDPKILNTLKVIDKLLKVETPFGPAWHRYNADGYGEHDDGSPFDGTGTGRLWPLLVGERAHYELSAGRLDEAQKLSDTMSSLANDGGLIPEQIWDAPDIPEKGLFFGRPSGSAMPLVWAHAEYIKLLRSLSDGKVFDTPEAVKHYKMTRPSTRFWVWRANHKCRSMSEGMTLRIELPAPAIVRWSVNGQAMKKDADTRDTGLGVHVADLNTAGLKGGARIDFTFLIKDENRWAGSDYRVIVLGQNDWRC